MELPEVSSSPEGYYFSEKADLTDEKMDTSDTTVGSEKAFSSPESLSGQSKCDNTNVNNSVVPDGLELKFRMRSDNSTSSLPSDDFELAKSYQAETVDFPDDPHILKMMNRMSMNHLGLIQENLGVESADDYNPGDDVFSHEQQQNAAEKTTAKDEDVHFLSESEISPLSCTRGTTSTPLLNVSLLTKIADCLGSLQITDQHDLCRKLHSVLSDIEIEKILQDVDAYMLHVHPDAITALRLIQNGQYVHTVRHNQTKIPVNADMLDETIAERFKNEMELTAVFEYGPSLPSYVKPEISRSRSGNLLETPTCSEWALNEAFFMESNSPQPQSLKKILVPMPWSLMLQNSPESDYSCSPNYSYDHDSDVSPLRKLSRVTEVSENTGDGDHRSERPSNISMDGSLLRKKIAVNPDILCAEKDDEKSLSSLSLRSDGEVFSPIDDIATPDDVDTPDELEESCLHSPDPIPELSAAEERAEERRWRTCMISGIQRKIDMKVIEPYKKVLSHGGYFGPSHYAIIVFSACHLPDHSRKDYDYVMDNLFLYVLTTLDQLVAEDYVLIYLHGAMERGSMPTFGWLKRCYQMIDRRLRKTLKGLYLVHPTFWLKTLVLMTKPFISTKFSRKLQFVHSLQELAELVPVDQICIPDKVKQYDEERRLLYTQ